MHITHTLQHSTGALCAMHACTSLSATCMWRHIALTSHAVTHLYILYVSWWDSLLFYKKIVSCLLTLQYKSLGSCWNTKNKIIHLNLHLLATIDWSNHQLLLIVLSTVPSMPKTGILMYVCQWVKTTGMTFDHYWLANVAEGSEGSHFNPESLLMMASWRADSALFWEHWGMPVFTCVDDGIKDDKWTVGTVEDNAWQAIAMVWAGGCHDEIYEF
jgi:hypothetical protein